VYLRSAAGAGLNGASLAPKSAEPADAAEHLAEAARQEAGGDDLPYGPGLDRAAE
jgi:hypothetical protein